MIFYWLKIKSQQFLYFLKITWFFYIKKNTFFVPILNKPASENGFNTWLLSTNMCCLQTTTQHNTNTKTNRRPTEYLLKLLQQSLIYKFHFVLLNLFPQWHFYLFVCLEQNSHSNYTKLNYTLLLFKEKRKFKKWLHVYLYRYGIYLHLKNSNQPFLSEGKKV